MAFVSTLSLGTSGFSGVEVSSRRSVRGNASVVMLAPRGLMPRKSMGAKVSGAAIAPRLAAVLGKRPSLISKLNGQMLTPVEAKADEFFANSVTRQFKEMVNWTGVYDPQCTEGAGKQEAWAQREMAVSKAFRYKQRSPAQVVGDFCENRRVAIQMIGHLCSAEEWKLAKFPSLARAYVMGKTEAMRTCVRYAVPETVEEAYMASCVDAANKKLGAPYGVYAQSCVEGNRKGQAEEARVAALGTAFRAGWKTPAQATGEKYAMSAYGRNIFAAGCSYEEDMFSKYPAVAAGMRAKSYRY